MTEALHPIASDIRELLRFEDAAFVDCAYKTLLNRAPDSTGFYNYLSAIRAGSSKMGLVMRMRLSAEGRRRSRSLPGLRPAIASYLLADNFLTGWWYRPIMKTEADTPVERRLRAVENSLARMNEELGRSIRDAGTATEDVTRLFKALTHRRKA